MPVSDERNAVRRMPMFPLGSVLLPGGVLPLHVFEPRYRRMMAHCLETERTFGVVLIARGSEVGGGDQRVSVGTEARIERAVEHPDGRWTVIALGDRRITVDSWLADDPYPAAMVAVEHSRASAPSTSILDEASKAVRRTFALLSELGRGGGGEEELFGDETDPLFFSWRLCDVAPLGPLDRQKLLEIDGVDERLTALTAMTEEVADDLHRILAEGGPR